MHIIHKVSNDNINDGGGDSPRVPKIYSPAVPVILDIKLYTQMDSITAHQKIQNR